MIERRPSPFFLLLWPRRRDAAAPVVCLAVARTTHSLPSRTGLTYLSAATPAMHDNRQAPHGEPCRCFITHGLFNHPIGAARLTAPPKSIIIIIIIIIGRCWETGDGRRKVGIPWAGALGGGLPGIGVFFGSGYPLSTFLCSVPSPASPMADKA